MNIKIKRWIYYNVYDPVYSVWYSFKDICLSGIDMLAEFKKPSAWSSILYIVTFYAIIMKKTYLFKWTIPGIIIVYVIRQRVDGAYRKALKEKAFLHNDEMILQDEYEKYKKECFFTKEPVKDFLFWKQAEVEKILKHKEQNHA